MLPSIRTVIPFLRTEFTETVTYITVLLFKAHLQNIPKISARPISIASGERSGGYRWGFVVIEGRSCTEGA